MKKSADAFRSIGEVAKLIGVAPHVLRYWETQFSQLKPMKRPDGRRYYRPEDVALVAGLCDVLRDEGLTIRGAKKLIARDRGETVRARGLERLNGANADSEVTKGTAPVVEPDTSVAPIGQEMVKPEPEREYPPDSATSEEAETTTRPEKSRMSIKPRSGKAAYHKLASGKLVSQKSVTSLPLFPDLSTHPDKRHGAWLSHLVRIATQLRQTQQLSGPTNRQCRILRDAISRHY